MITEEIAYFIKEKDTHVLFAIKPIIDKLKDFLPEYEQETGTVGELMELKYPSNPKAYSAPLDEIEEIVRIVAEDEGIGTLFYVMMIAMRLFVMLEHMLNFQNWQL